MMEDKLRVYLWWKGKLNERKQDGKAPFQLPDAAGRRQNDEAGRLYSGDDGISEALKRKDKERAERSASRRRVRGGAPNLASSGNGRVDSLKPEAKDSGAGETQMRDEAESIADLYVLH
jgi:DNA excision repair protein ERCC-4